jgi:hypothetical protein
MLMDLVYNQISDDKKKMKTNLRYLLINLIECIEKIKAQSSNNTGDDCR